MFIPRESFLLADLSLIESSRSFDSSRSSSSATDSGSSSITSTSQASISTVISSSVTSTVASSSAVPSSGATSSQSTATSSSSVSSSSVSSSSSSTSLASPSQGGLATSTTSSSSSTESSSSLSTPASSDTSSSTMSSTSVRQTKGGKSPTSSSGGVSTSSSASDSGSSTTTSPPTASGAGGTSPPPPPPPSSSPSEPTAGPSSNGQNGSPVASTSQNGSPASSADQNGSPAASSGKNAAPPTQASNVSDGKTVPISTSTITDQPFSTFSTPISVTLTNADGQKVTTAPQLVTSVGTSTNAAGASVVYTHVIANPTGSFSNSGASSNSGFLQKPREVIGVFIAVGVVAAAIIGCLVCVFHRRQRRLRNERTHWNFNQRQRPSESILDLPDVPPPRTIQIDIHRKPSVVWGPKPRSGEDMTIVDGTSPSPGATSPSPGPSLPSPVHPADSFHDVGFAEHGSGTQVVSPFGDHHAIPRSTTGLAVTSGQQMLRHSFHSLAASEPSIYPDTISMSTVEEEGESLYDHISPFDDRSATPTDSRHHSPSPPTSLASESNHKPSSPVSIQLKPMVTSPTAMVQPHTVHDRPFAQRQV